MDLYQLKKDQRVRTVDGSLVEVLAETEDGQWVRVRYVESPKDPHLVDSEDLCHESELRELEEETAHER